MKKDEQSLLRMNFLIQAGRLYSYSYPELASILIYDFVQMSQKKMIRIDKKLKKKIDKKKFKFRSSLYFKSKPQEKDSKEMQQQMMVVGKEIEGQQKQ